MNVLWPESLQVTGLVGVVLSVWLLTGEAGWTVLAGSGAVLLVGLVAEVMR